ncbi:hypothetical protein CTEN210_08200 [Chaetoceros tenuissimus]|uniref:Uncharacterized protein n=1 Tax=Chaetoceros tenuissimus TaxID=426638 RepID=A0AAD3H6H4_9STRA|nr:hypothetical protein CTEN210_08200 [Chaetoceros tenuissimus]
MKDTVEIDNHPQYDLQSALSLLGLSITGEQADFLRKKFHITTDEQITMQTFLQIKNYLDLAIYEQEISTSRDDDENSKIYELLEGHGDIELDQESFQDKNQGEEEEELVKFRPKAASTDISVTEKIKDRLDLAQSDLLGLPKTEKDRELLDNLSHLLHEFDSDEDFISAYDSSEMKALAIYADVEMVDMLYKFIRRNKNLLKKFCLTGDRVTLQMLDSIYEGDEDLVMKPWAEDDEIEVETEVVDSIPKSSIGGLIIFEGCSGQGNWGPCFDSLCQYAVLGNLLVANTASTALMMVNTMRMALKDAKGELIPSFFLNLKHPYADSFEMKTAVMMEEDSPDLVMGEPSKEFETTNTIPENDEPLMNATDILRNSNENDVNTKIVEYNVENSRVSKTIVTVMTESTTNESETDDNNHDTSSVVYDFARPDSASSRPSSRKLLERISQRPSSKELRRQRALSERTSRKASVDALTRRNSAEKILSARFATFVTKFSDAE